MDEIEIALPNDDGDDYELVFNEGPTKEQAKAAAEEPEMTSRLAAKEFTKKKRKSMMELKKYTGSDSKKTKRTATSSRVGLRKERCLW